MSEPRTYLAHTWHYCGDECTGCQFCDGGIRLCTMCGKGEGELDEDCPGELSPWYMVLDALHTRLKEAVDAKDAEAIENLFQECYARPESDGECCTCGWLICPHKEPLHYHHAGCPACDGGCV